MSSENDIAKINLSGVASVELKVYKICIQN
jgi:hypothetical protein